jgi:cholesterol transport system auxiliary component
MKRFLISCAAFLLAACAGSGTKAPDIARYDLGIAPIGGGTQVLTVRSVEFGVPSWLATPAMQYRLSYADAGRRENYAASRWAAPPAELLEVALRRRLIAGTGDAGNAGCRLRFELDEFVQVFDAVKESRAVIDGRILVLAPRGDQILARRHLNLSKAAPTADSQGGVAAFVGLTEQINRDTASWLAKLAVDDPGLGQRCRGNQ